MAVIKEEFFKKSAAVFSRNEKAVKLITFILFVSLTFVIGFFHEPWTDEAQSWLIARDTGVRELFGVMAYEGSPPLWQLVLKVFIFFGLPYRCLFLIPFLFSALGVWLLIYKSKIPIVLAMVLPFTYYIFYQYTIIARSYCLILPCIQLIVIAYPKRLRNPYLYGLLLILLSGICIHTALLSGVLFLLFCIDIVKKLKQQTKTQTISAVAVAVVVTLSYLFTLWHLRPPSDYSFPAYFAFDIKNISWNFLNIFGNLLIYNDKTLLHLMVLIITLGTLVLFYKLSIRFILIASAIWLFLSTFYYNQWHVGTILLSCLLAYQLYPPQSKSQPVHIVKKKFYCYIIAGVFLCVQFFWSASTAVYDIFHPYSGAAAAAEFIKENGYDKQRLYGLGFNATAIQPYFDANIFENKTLDTSYYIWSKNNGDLKVDQILNDMPPVLVISEYDQSDFFGRDETAFLSGYACYSFDGASYVKQKVYEPQRYFVYVKENPDIPVLP